MEGDRREREVDTGFFEPAGGPYHYCLLLHRAAVNLRMMRGAIHRVDVSAWAGTAPK